jgi:hypothetical protein
VHKSKGNSIGEAARMHPDETTASHSFRTVPGRKRKLLFLAQIKAKIGIGFSSNVIGLIHLNTFV